MDANFNPTRLTIARQRLKLSKKDLAARTKVSVKTIMNYEDGATAPSDAFMATLSVEIGFPLEFFFGGDIPSPDVANASFRSFSRMTSGQRYAALSAGGMAFALSDWMAAQFHLPTPQVPDHSGVDPEAAAEMVRMAWGLGKLPIKNMIHLIESKGVRVFTLVEDTKEVNAFSCWKQGEVPFVFLNTYKSSESSRFDAAHELGHLVLHRHGDTKGKQVENEANAFASAFLMPRQELLATAGHCSTMREVMSIKKRWNVSAMALVYRLHKVGVLTDYVYRSMCIELSSRGFRTNEENSAERESSLLLKKIFEELKTQNRGLRDISHALALPIGELHKLLVGLTPVALGVENSSPDKSPPRRGHLTLVR